VRVDGRRHNPRRRLCVAAGVTAASAYGGAIGLLVGGVDFGDTINHRLPFDSRPLAGLALAAIVGAPFTALAVLAGRDDPRTDCAAIVAGTTLIGWIVVQVVVIRSLSALQPICVIVGAAFLWVGISGRRRKVQSDRLARRIIVKVEPRFSTSTKPLDSYRLRAGLCSATQRLTAGYP
jgi:hypothetical protein